jgi:hypothetical protein
MSSVHFREEENNEAKAIAALESLSTDVMLKDDP